MSDADKRSDRFTHSEEQATTGLYLGVYGLLLFLLAISIVLAFIDLGGFGLVIGLGIAGAKTLLIILFFMHVYYSSRLTKLASAAAFGHLIILFGLTMADYVSRSITIWGG
ncbi:MAG: cytochrome C oxidase subunit IV family protein [Bradymonadaceae bacterium]